MAHEDKIAQVLGVIPSLSPDQIDALNKFDTAPLDGAVESAEENFGYEAERHLSIVNVGYVSVGVIQLARTAILGILAEDQTLTSPWTTIVGDFAHEEAEIETVSHTESESGVQIPVTTPVAQTIEVPGVVTGGAETPTATVEVTSPTIGAEATTEATATSGVAIIGSAPVETSASATAQDPAAGAI